MSEQTTGNKLHQHSSLSNLRVQEDASVEISTNSKTGKAEIKSVKPIYRPIEKETLPIKTHWLWVWLIVIALVVLAWLFLFSYFSNHHAPFSAPL